MKKQNKWIISLGIAMLMGIANTAVLYGMEPTGKDELTLYFEKLIKKKILPKDIERNIRRLQLMHDALLFSVNEKIFFNDAPINLTATSGNKVITVIGNNILIFEVDLVNHSKRLPSFILPFYRKHISSIAMDGNKIVMGFDRGGTVEILDMNKIMENTEVMQGANNTQFYRVNTNQLLFLEKQMKEVDSVAISGNKVVTLSANIVETWNANDGTLLHTFTIPDKEFSLAVIGGDKAATLSGYTLKIWNIENDMLVNTLPVNLDGKILSLAISNHYVSFGLENKAFIFKMDLSEPGKSATLPEAKTIKSVALSDERSVILAGGSAYTRPVSMSIVLQGTPEDNPLLWLIHYATITQAEFIKRAYAAIIAGEDLIIALPEKFGEIKEGEPQAQRDGRTYFSFPAHVREYLRSNFNIRK